MCVWRGNIFRKLHFTLTCCGYSTLKYKLANFSNERTDLKLSWDWQYCALPAEKRGEDRFLSWLQRGNFAEDACALLGVGELLKDLNAGCTVKSAFLVPAKCWHHILPLCLQCTFTWKPFQSCYCLLTFKTLPPAHCSRREEFALLKSCVPWEIVWYVTSKCIHFRFN